MRRYLAMSLVPIMGLSLLGGPMLPLASPSDGEPGDVNPSLLLSTNSTASVNLVAKDAQVTRAAAEIAGGRVRSDEWLVDASQLLSTLGEPTPWRDTPGSASGLPVRVDRFMR